MLSKDEVLSGWVPNELQRLLDRDEAAIIGYLRYMRSKHKGGKLDIIIRNKQISNIQPSPLVQGEGNEDEK